MNVTILFVIVDDLCVSVFIKDFHLMFCGLKGFHVDLIFAQKVFQVNFVVFQNLKLTSYFNF